MKVVKMEAKVLQTMGDFLTQNKKEENENMNEILERIEEWLDRADESYKGLQKLIDETEVGLSELDLTKFH